MTMSNAVTVLEQSKVENQKTLETDDIARPGADNAENAILKPLPPYISLNGAPPDAIKWRVHYENEEGKLLEKGPYTPHDPELKPEPEAEDTEPLKPSVFEILIHVTIRDIIETKSIRTEAAAAKAGQSQEGEQGSDVGAVKPQNLFKIQSVNSCEMIIRSSYLVEALRSVVKYYPGQELAGETVTIPEPYYILLHHRKELAAYFTKDIQGDPQRVNDIGTERKSEIEGPDSLGQGHFKVLQAYLDARWKKKIEREETRHALTPPTATFEMLWMLFKPGTRVFAKDPHDETAGYIVRSLTNKDDKLYVNLWYLEFDGTYLDRREYSAVIDSFEGAREITSLPVYPVQIATGGSNIQLDTQLKKKLEDRGRKYWGCVEKVFRNNFVEVKYAGRLLDMHSDEDYKGKAVIDPESFYSKTSDYSKPHFLNDNDEEFPNDCYWTDPPDSDHAKRGPWSSYQNISAKNKYHQLHEGHFFLMPKRIGGFLLKTRKWRYMDIEQAVECVIDKSVVDTLQIPAGRLDMIAALVYKFDKKDKAWAADFIQNKGEGQIFLLHGPSGVGKTYTAECISEYTGRPLLSLTCADIGTDESEMENLLATWFSLSELWGAIMLIDEADVYFERRAPGQLQRNSLVSAFLRSMEYYSGILFLTTNRLGHMDDAILSRIHLVIEYTDLTEDIRVKIWKQFFNKLTKERPQFGIDEYLIGYIEEDPTILALKWNGREIRNAFQTAVSLAAHEAKTADPPKERIILRKKHLVSVANMSMAFKKYMNDWKGDMAKRAFLDGARMDESIRRYGRERKQMLDQLRKDAMAKR